MKTEEQKTTVARAIDNRVDHWAVDCPDCDLTMEYTGFFDSGEEYTCQHCKIGFYAEYLEGEKGWMVL